MSSLCNVGAAGLRPIPEDPTEHNPMDERTIRLLLASMRYDDDIPRQPTQQAGDWLVIRGYLVARDLPNDEAINRPAPAAATFPAIAG